MAYNTIVLIGDLSRYHDEARCDATAIKPGHLIYLESTGKVAPHATAGGKAMPYFAKEQSLGGDPVVVGYSGPTIETAYAEGNLVLFHKAQRGHRIYALLAAGENAAKGDWLSSNGDGTFQVLSGSEVGIATAQVAVDNSLGGTPVRIEVEVA